MPLSSQPQLMPQLKKTSPRAEKKSVSNTWNKPENVKLLVTNLPNSISNCSENACKSQSLFKSFMKKSTLTALIWKKLANSTTTTRTIPSRQQISKKCCSNKSKVSQHRRSLNSHQLLQDSTRSTRQPIKRISAMTTWASAVAWELRNVN